MQMILEKANHISVYQCRRKTVFSNDNIVVKDRMEKLSINLPVIDYLWFVL